jgi:hypothetical protein
MSPNNRPDEIGLAGGTGWVLFDWTSGDRLPWVRVAGSMPATRLQFDRYRQILKCVGWAGQVQVWAWSVSTFTIDTRYIVSGSTVTNESRSPHVYPESVSVETSVTPREYRVTLSGGFGTWGSGSYQTSRTTTANQMTIAGRYFGQYSFPWGSNITRRTIRPAATSGVRVRILVIGHQNAFWQSDGIT